MSSDPMQSRALASANRWIGMSSGAAIDRSSMRRACHRRCGWGASRYIDRSAQAPRAPSKSCWLWCFESKNPERERLNFTSSLLSIAFNSPSLQVEWHRSPKCRIWSSSRVAWALETWRTSWSLAACPKVTHMTPRRRECECRSPSPHSVWRHRVSHLDDSMRSEWCDSHESVSKLASYSTEGHISPRLHSLDAWCNCAHKCSSKRFRQDICCRNSAAAGEIVDSR